MILCLEVKMTKREMEIIDHIDTIKKRPCCVEELKPFLRDRTLLYGYESEMKMYL